MPLCGFSEQTFTVSYDASALERYNAANGTSYEALPENLITIYGTATIAAGEQKSKAVKIGYSTADNLKKDGTYAIPLTVKGSGAATSAEKGDFIYLVRDITKMPNCHKGTGQIVISCQETNDATPLHNLCYTLKESGKYVIDQVWFVDHVTGFLLKNDNRRKHLYVFCSCLRFFL